MFHWLTYRPLPVPAAYQCPRCQQIGTPPLYMYFIGEYGPRSPDLAHMTGGYAAGQVYQGPSLFAQAAENGLTNTPVHPVAESSVAKFFSRTPPRLRTVPARLPAAPPDLPSARQDVQQTSLQTAAVETAAVKRAAVKTSAVKTSAVKTSAVKTSAVKTSAVKTSAVKTSAVKTSAAKTSAATTDAAQAGAAQPAATQQIVREVVVLVPDMSAAAARQFPARPASSSRWRRSVPYYDDAPGTDKQVFVTDVPAGQEMPFHSAGSSRELPVHEASSPLPKAPTAPLPSN
jgi:hypothetical protein